MNLLKAARKQADKRRKNKTSGLFEVVAESMPWHICSCYVPFKGRDHEFRDLLNLDLPAQFDDAIGRDAEELGRVEGQFGEQHE